MGSPPAKSPFSYSTTPSHHTTHTFAQFFTLMLSVFFSRSTLFPSLCLSLSLSFSLSLSVLNTDTCSIYNSLALREPFWTGSCPLPTPNRGFFPKRQHPLLLHLLPLEQAREELLGGEEEECVCARVCVYVWWGLKISHPTLSAPGLGPCVCFSQPRPTHILYTLTH